MEDGRGGNVAAIFASGKLEAMAVAYSSSGSDANPVQFGFENTYARLPERFFSRQNPVAVAAPRLIKVNSGIGV